MNTLLPIIFVFSIFTASAAPLYFNRALLAGHADMVKVMHGSHVDGLKKLRYLYLLPKVGANFSDGLGSGNEGGEKVHTGLKLDNGHLMTELFGLSDCSEWLAYVVGDYYNGAVTYKAYHGLKTDTLTAGTDLAPLVDFVKDKVKKAAFDALWPLMPAHHVVLALKGKYGGSCSSGTCSL